MADATPENDQIAAAVERLGSGGLVAFPTETVYGLGADAFNAAAVERAFRLKGRPPSNPMIVHASDTTMARTVTARWPDAADALANALWPGPLTLVLPKADRIPEVVTAGGPTVAVRVPDHELTLRLIARYGSPVVGPSANPSGYLSPTAADHVASHWSTEEVYVLDGGACTRGLESTVLDLSGEDPTVLRRGVLGAEDLEPVLGRSVVFAGDTGGQPPDATQPSRSPGLLGAHYAPKTPLRLLDDIADLSRLVAAADGPLVILGPPGRSVRVSSPHTSIDMPGLASGYARHLYSALRRADGAGASEIIVVTPLLKDSEVWQTIRDRLGRAAEAAG